MIVIIYIAALLITLNAFFTGTMINDLLAIKHPLARYGMIVLSLSIATFVWVFNKIAGYIHKEKTK